MVKFLNFVTNNYVFFLIVTIILILALIGIVSEKLTQKDVTISPKKKPNPNENKVETVTQENPVTQVQETNNQQSNET